MNLWFARYNTQYFNEASAEGGEGGSGEGVAHTGDAGSADAGDGSGEGSVDSGDASAALGDGSSGWGDFDLDAFLAYDPMKPEESKPESKEKAESEPEPTSEPQAPVAPPAEPVPEPDPRDLELQLLREQLQNMVQGQQVNQGQLPLDTSQEASDSELAQLYQVPASYSQMQIPAPLMDEIMSGDPARAAAGMNQFAQGLAHIIHAQVAQQAQAREALIAKRIEEKASKPVREAQAQESARKLHDDFYSKHKVLDKPEWKPYIALKMKQLAQQYRITEPTQVFLDMGAELLKKELLKGAQAPAATAPAAPAQRAPAAPYMAGQGAGRASSPGAKTPQDDIFDTLMQM